MAALHWLHDDCRKIFRILANPLEGVISSVFEHHHIGGFFAWDARGTRNGKRFAVFLEAFYQHFVEHTVIVASEENNLVAAGNGTSHAHRGNHRFRASVAKSCPLVSGHFAKSGGYFAREDGLRPDFEALMQLLFDCDLDKVRAMTEHDRSKAIQDVYVFIAVNVPQPRAFRLRGDDRIDHLLPLHAETGHDARIGKNAAVLLGLAF